MTTPTDIIELQRQLITASTDYDITIREIAILGEDYTPRQWDELIATLNAQGRTWLAGTAACARSQVETLARLAEATVIMLD